MNTVSIDVVKKLINSAAPCVSIYLPCVRAGENVQHNRIRYKNLLSDADEQSKRTSPKAKHTLPQAAQLLDDHHFWSHPSDGVAVFLSPDGIQAFRLPLASVSSLHVGPRPYIKPLLPLLETSGLYHLIAVSENCARLFRGSQHELDEVALDTLPKDLNAVRHEHNEGQMLVRTGQTALRGKEGRVFYGDRQEDEQKNDLEDYLREIDGALTPYLRNFGQDAPLIFCGVLQLFPLYREIATYSQLFDQPITGNFDRATTKELLDKASEILTPYWAQQRRLDAQQLLDQIRTGHVSADIETILRAACDGRVAVAFVASNVEIAGTYNPQTRSCALGQSPVSEDLLNVAAADTLMHGGRVYAVQAKELPVGLVASARFRYS
jgi:hypothetical protein